MTEEYELRSRRAFLHFLAASPAVYAGDLAFGQILDDPYAPQVVSRPGDAVNVFDFREVAKQSLLPAHYTRISFGAADGGTVRSNREGFQKLHLRTRRLVDVRKIDTSIELFGERYPIPVLLAPCGSQKAYHPEGEVAVARAARSRGIEQMLSTGTSTAVEDVNAARGRPVWFQLNPDGRWKEIQKLVKRVESAGCPVLVLTVDSVVRYNEALLRYHRDTNPECQVCHADNVGRARKPMFEGIERRMDARLGMDWDFVVRLKRFTSMKLILKGIVTAEDATLAVEHGVDGIIVSNHGGRTVDSGRSTIESLPEVVNAIAGRMPVIVDSGFRRGTDIFKALALGADAIDIGRPYLWGLASFGQEGVEAVLDILKREIEMVMRQSGTTRIDEITRSFVAWNPSVVVAD